MTSHEGPALVRNTPETARRRGRRAMGWLLLLGAAILAALVLDWRSPWQAPLRPLLTLGVPLGSGVLMAVVLRRDRRHRIAGRVTLLLAAFALVGSLAGEARFRWIRYRVLTAEPERLARVGRHVVVGYRDADELETLLERRAVGGVFVTSRNVAGRAAPALAAELRRFQAIRRRSGEPPLWIAADQEGGKVSRLSPPLPPLPALAVVATSCGAPGGCPASVTDHARAQGRGLASLGVNLDLSPVVDLDHHLLSPGAAYTRVHQRAIGADPLLVRRVADRYCAGLGGAGVACTLKHFPGLGRVLEDTHRTSATLAASAADLITSDWLPFGAALGHPGRFTMLGHARLGFLDPDRPASISHAVVGGLLRGAWGHDGPFVTDDLCMSALARSRWGVGEGSVQALDAGVDLLLVSYDPDLVYVALDALLRADRAGRLHARTLAASDERLARARRALEEARTDAVFPDPAIGAGHYPAELAADVTRTFRERGVRVLSGERVAGVEDRGERAVVRTASGTEIEGDAACFPSDALGERVRVEHEDAAVTMGRTAGRNMAGAGEPYVHLPFFYSDMFELGYEAVGRLDSRLDTVSSWKTPFREGVVYYLEGERVRGVLLWGIFGRVDAARALLSGRAPLSRDALADAISG